MVGVFGNKQQCTIHVLPVSPPVVQRCRGCASGVSIAAWNSAMDSTPSAWALMVSLEAISFSGPLGSIVEGSHTIRLPSRDAETSMSPPPGRGLDRGRRAVTALVWPWI